MPTENQYPTNAVRREAILFLILLPVGLFLLPAAVYIVGSAIFGEFGGDGFGAFYGMLIDELRGGEPAVWFLILSPYLVWQLLRLTFGAFRAAGSGR
jgi:hypothetical protein